MRDCHLFQCRYSQMLDVSFQSVRHYVLQPEISTFLIKMKVIWILCRKTRCWHSAENELNVQSQRGLRLSIFLLLPCQTAASTLKTHPTGAWQDMTRSVFIYICYISNLLIIRLGCFAIFLLLQLRNAWCTLMWHCNDFTLQTFLLLASHLPKQQRCYKAC